jgi:hypothetical protein
MVGLAGGREGARNGDEDNLLVLEGYSPKEEKEDTISISRTLQHGGALTFAGVKLCGDAAAGEILALRRQGDVAKGDIAWEVVSDLEDRHGD